MTHDLIDVSPALDLRQFVAPGSPVRVGVVELVPLVARNPIPLPSIEMLDEGLRGGRTSVTEVSEQGVVGAVRVRHQGPSSLLILDGEEIVGAKQNRAFNGTFLVQAGGDVTLPVSCVERGRWRPVSRGFAAASRTIVPSVRAQKIRSTVTMLMTRGTYESDQGSVWREVTSFGERTLVGSPTDSLSDRMASRETDLRDALAALEVLPQQVGLAAVACDRMIAADILGSPELYARAWRKIAIGVAGEVPVGPRGTRPAALVVHEALGEVARTARYSRAAPGGGTTLVGAGPRLVVSSLIEQGRLVHAVVVPA